MASTPRQTSSQQHPSEQATASPAPDTSSTHQQRRSSIPQSSTSESSSTVLLNHPSSSESSPKPEDHSAEPQSRPKAQTAVSSVEPRKCWICLEAETEDTPTSSQWRSPCACHLQAHESCLLDWVAEVERPKPNSPASSKVQCPQCKTPIRVARPRSIITELVRGVSRIQGRAMIPITAIVLIGGITYGCYIHGYYSVYIIFGAQDADRVLGAGPGHSLNNNLEWLLPLIPVTLLVSRTHYLDSFLPILPLFYFAVAHPTRHASFWPPSATMTLIALPYLRAAYTHAYQYLFAEREKAWINVIQPRAGEQGDGDNQQNQNDPNQEDDGMNFELGDNMELGIRMEVIEEVEAEPEAGPQPAHGDQAPPAQENAGGEGQPRPPQPAQQPPNQPQVANAPNAIPILLNVAFEKTFGALLFPGIAAGVGMALQWTLPRKWVAPPSFRDRYPVGFLQSHFGRSIAGGCLFVVIRDSLLLYSKYKTAQMHKQRRILDYDRAKGTSAEAK